MVVDMVDGTSTVLYSPRDRKQTKNFAFDHCFWSIDSKNSKYADQEKVYNCLGKDVLENAFEGYNACIFAYGQTGSGKTYTMMGAQADKGVIPRLCDNLFAGISTNDNQDVNYRVEVSYIEIYNEKVRDLLCPTGGNTSLRVREHKVLGPYVEGLTKLVVSSYEDIETIMIEGNKSRTVAATRMNTESSRSHAVFNIVLARTEYDHQTECIGEKVSKMSLVDLAGSERASKTGAEGDRLKEGSNINKSLTTLGQVISSLADQSSVKHHRKGTPFVPYRDSVLTWLLKDNLGGNSKTVMVATVSPSADNYEETLSTLRYADRAKRIVNHAVVNEDPNARIIRELREEVERLKQMLQLKIAGKLSPEEEGEFAIQEQLTESEKLIKECTMSWEQKEKQTEQIQQERHKALEDMGISVQSSGIAVEKNKFYLVNLNADPSMTELLVYYLKDHTKVGRLRPNLPPPDIQLGGLGILPEHSTMDIEGNEVYLTSMPNARTFVNGKDVKEKTLLKHGDRILWGNNHFFRINCPLTAGSENQENQAEQQPVDFMSAQQELMMNQIVQGPLHESIKALEEQYQADKQGALEKQRLMYEEKIEELRNQVQTNPNRQSMDRSWSMGSFSSGYGSRMSWYEDRDLSNQFEKQEQRPLVLKEAVLQANTLVREANQLSEEMGKDTEFAVTLQIPTSSLSFGRSRSGFSSEVAIVVKHKTNGTQIWSLENLENKIFDMRELYNQCVEEGVSFSSKDEDSDLFFEVECHTLIGVTNVFLECLLHDVSHEYAAPIISQQGEIFIIIDSDSESVASSSDGRESPIDDEIEDVEDLEEFKLGNRMEVCVNVIEAFDLPPALCNYVFCQYQLWKDKDTVVVPPINASLSHPGPKTNTMIFENKQSFDIEITEDFLEYASEGSLAIEVWGNRSQGFDSKSNLNWNYNVETPQKGLHDRWHELVRKLDLWFEVHEINDLGVYAPVELNIREGKETGGIFQLRQGHSRRVVVKVNPIPKSGALPVVCNTITNVSIGSICVRNKLQQGLDSYQEKDLSLMREKWSNSLMKRREYLDQQIHSSMGSADIDKSVVDKERESWLIDQWVNLTEERNAVLCPLPGSGIPGAPPLEENIHPGLEAHIPVIFLDLNDDFRNVGADDVGPAGVDSTLSFENPDNMISLPIIKYDQKQVSATASWDSSSHDAIELTRVTGSNERVYLIVKVVIGLTSPVTMELVLRKRICVRIYKKQSWKDSLLRRLTKDLRYSCGVVYELVSHIPRQPGEETEERASLAQMAAQAVGEEEEDETVLRRYSKGISNVESLLALDKLRQEVQVKEKLAAIGKPLRKFASTPNLAASSAMSDLSFGGSPGRFDTAETARFLDFKSYGMNSGLTSDPRANRTYHGREDALIDFSSYTVSPPTQSSTPTTTSGVILRNSAGRNQNPRPSSLVMDLETLSEDSKEPSSPRVEIPDHFDFSDTKLPQTTEVTSGLLPGEVRERTASSDTITFDENAGLAYEDLPTPTPFQFMKNTKAIENTEKLLDKSPSSDEKTPENEDPLGVGIFDALPSDKKPIKTTINNELISRNNENLLLDLNNSDSVEQPPLSTINSTANNLISLNNDNLEKSEQLNDLFSLKMEDFLQDGLSALKPESTPKNSDDIPNNDKSPLLTIEASDSTPKSSDDIPNNDKSPLLTIEPSDSTPKSSDYIPNDEKSTLLTIDESESSQKSLDKTPNDDISPLLSIAESDASPKDSENISEEHKYLLSIDEPESSPMDSEKTTDEDKYFLSTSRDDLDSFGSRDDLASSMDSLEWNEASLGNIKPGMAVWLGEGKTGVVRFTGPTEFSPGMWVGVELDKPGGRNDGSVQGVRYFACKPRFGSFVRPDKVTPIEHSARERSTSRRITGSRDNNARTSSNRALNKTESSSRTSLVKGTSRLRTESPSRGRTDSSTTASRSSGARAGNASPVVKRDNAGKNRKKDDWKRRSNILF